MKNLLVELFVEELPPKALKSLSEAFAAGLAKGLRDRQFLSADSAVTAFGAINDTRGQVRFVIDSTLLKHSLINAHPLTNTATTSIAGDDLLRFLRATGHEPVILKVSD